jgi:hypothetical protein
MDNHTTKEMKDLVGNIGIRMTDECILTPGITMIGGMVIITIMKKMNRRFRREIVGYRTGTGGDPILGITTIMMITRPKTMMTMGKKDKDSTMKIENIIQSVMTMVIGTNSVQVGMKGHIVVDMEEGMTGDLVQEG